MIRPGRCFARVYVRELVEAEAAAFVLSLTPDAALARAVMSQLFGGSGGSSGRKSRSLAEIYKALKTASETAPRPLAAAA